MSSKYEQPPEYSRSFKFRPLFTNYCYWICKQRTKLEGSESRSYLVYILSIGLKVLNSGELVRPRTTIGLCHNPKPNVMHRNVVKFGLARKTLFTKKWFMDIPLCKVGHICFSIQGRSRLYKALTCWVNARNLIGSYGRGVASLNPIPNGRGF